jgi:hypothetical protein
LVLVSGGAGIGKTALVRRATTSADSGTDVLWGRATEEGGAPPFWIWIQILRRLSQRQPDGTGGSGPDVSTALRTLGGGWRGAPTDSDAARFALFDQVLQILVEAGSSAPLVVVLEDLHAADVASLKLLRFVIDHAVSERICVIGTFRDDEATQRVEIAHLLASIGGRGSHIRLSGLKAGDVAELVQAASGIPIDEAFARKLHSKTDGNPFFALQLAAVLSRRPPHATSMPLPEEIRALVRSRIALLPEPTRDVLAVAAIIGRRFETSVLSLLTDFAGDVGSVLEPAAQIGLIEGDGHAFTFVHALVFEAIVEEQAPDRRRRLHRDVAEALARTVEMTGARVMELAHHYLNAVPDVDPSTVVVWVRRAALQAERAFAFEEAAALYERLLDVVPDERSKCEILLGHARTSKYAFGSSAIPIYEQAAALASRLGERELLGEATLGVVGDPESFTVYERETALLRDAIAQVDAESATRAMLLGRLSTSLVLPEAEKRELATEALDLARKVGDLDVISYVLRAKQAMLLAPQDGHERLELANELLVLGESTGRDDLTAVGRMWRCMALFQLDDFLAGEAELDTAEATAQRIRDPMLQTIALLGRAMLALRKGDLDDAETRVRAAHQLLARAGLPWRDFPLLMILLPIAVEREEDLEEVTSLVDSLIPHNPGNVLLQAVRALVRLYRGDDSPARQLLEGLTAKQLQVVTPDMRSAAALFVARLAWLLRDRRSAEVCYGFLRQNSGFTAFLGGTAAYLGQFDLFLGHLATVVGDHGRTEKHLLEALRRDRRIGALLGEVHDRIALAELYLELDRHHDADRVVADALKTATSLQLNRSVHELERLRERLASAPIAANGPIGTARFTREGEFWTLAFGEEEARLRHSKGMVYLATLLAHPGRELHAIEIAGAYQRDLPGDDRRIALSAEQGIELIDDEAKAAYRERVEHLRAEIDEATALADIERSARAKAELQALEDHLSSAIGLRGRARKASTPAERARLSVGRAVKTSIRRIKTCCPSLGDHLEATVRTGYYCSYRPDPRAPLEWRL